MSENNQALQPSIRQSSEKHCHACATVLHVTASMCPKCGAPQSTSLVTTEASIKPAMHIPDAIFCRGCGQSIHKTAQICPKCGAAQVVSINIGRDRLTAGLLGIFLGGFGVHKFYLGKFFQGLLYLIFFWTVIPAIIGFIEGVYYLTLSETEFAKNYG